MQNGSFLKFIKYSLFSEEIRDIVMCWKMFGRETVFRQEYKGTSEELPFSRNSCNHQK